MPGDSDPVVISCLSDDDGDEGVTTGNSDAISQKENLEKSQDEEVEVVDKADAAATPVTKTAAASSRNHDGDNDEELEIVGTANEQRFPHSRQDCLEFRYVAPGGGGGGDNDNDNAKFCSLCYCYVCDRPAGECDNWTRGGRGACAEAPGVNAKSAEDNDSNSSNNNREPHKNHCDATDKGPAAALWRNMRKAIKEGRDPTQVSNTEDAGRSNLEAYTRMLENYASNYASHAPGHNGMGGGGASRARHRNPATARGGARQRRARSGGGHDSSASSIYGSSTHAAAYAAHLEQVRAQLSRSTSRAAAPAGRARSRSAPVAARGRRRARSSGGSSARRSRPAPHDHRQRIRTQRMLEDLYG